ncbi:MAG: phosphatase PAP2 family protein [Chloroflexota bacterium]
MFPSQRGDNEFAAMPSIHIFYALIVGCTLAWALRPWILRVLALLYPVLLLVVVVVTANHYLMDAVGGAIVFCIAASTSLILYESRHRDGHRAAHPRPMGPAVITGR